MSENQPALGGAPADDLDLELAAMAPPKEDKPADKQDAKPAELPDKFRGKSVEDMVQMYQNLEREKSRQANELGEVRRLADQLISVKPDNTQKPEPKPITVEALLDNPNKALSDALEHSPAAQAAAAATRRVDDLDRKIAYGDFVRAHPEFQKDIQDPAFTEWVQKNPARAALAAAADKYDFNAANALWGMWDEFKEIKGSKQVEQANETASRASTVRATPAAGAKADGPIYSRAKLMDLRVRANMGDRSARDRLNDPAFQARLADAYANDRVR